MAEGRGLIAGDACTRKPKPEGLARTDILAFERFAQITSRRGYVNQKQHWLVKRIITDDRSSASFFLQRTPRSFALDLEQPTHWPEDARRDRLIGD